MQNYSVQGNTSVWRVLSVLLVFVVLAVGVRRYFSPVTGQSWDSSEETKLIATDSIGQNSDQKEQLFISLVCNLRKVQESLNSTKALTNNVQDCCMEDYKVALTKLENKYPGPHFVVFTAGLDPQTSEPWCPDSRRSLFIIRNVVLSVGGSLLEIMVGDMPTWKNQNHPLRHDPLFLVTGIPTLMRWRDGKPIARTGRELEKAPTQDQAKDFIQQFVHNYTV